MAEAATITADEFKRRLEDQFVAARRQPREWITKGEEYFGRMLRSVNLGWLFDEAKAAKCQVQICLDNWDHPQVRVKAK